jgi:hypothetical protein
VTFPPLVPDVAAHTEAARHDHGLRCHAGGYVRSPEDSRGRCSWTWRWEDTTLMCWHYDLPGHGACPHHLALALDADA